MRIGTLIFFSSSLLFSDTLSNTLSSQGFTGLINTPNAQVLKEGDAVFHFSNQFDNHLRRYDYSQGNVSQENYIMGLGFLSSFEIIGRLSEVAPFKSDKNINRLLHIRDLSLNAKYNIVNSSKYLPALAVGVQDFGGALSFFSNYYVVLDKEFGFLRTSLGYGMSRSNNKSGSRMDGFFGGIEGEVNNWASILAEHDGQEKHVALRLRMPNNWLSLVNVDATVIQNLTEPQTSIAVNLSLPLFYNDSFKEVNPVIEESYRVKTQASSSTVLKQKKYKTVELQDKTTTLLKIQNRLVEIGFENVQVGYYEKSIYVKVENTIFDYTELDALGVIMGSLIQNLEDSEHYIITLLKNNLQTMTISGNVKDTRNYFKAPNTSSKLSLKNSLQFGKSFNERDVNFISKKQNSSFFIPRLELSPGLITTVGTEVGLFDYLVTLRANAYTTLNDGLTLSTMYEVPLMHSQNFEDGYPFAIQYSERLKSRLVNTMLHQTVHYQSLFNTTSIGQFKSDYYGVLNHSNFTPTSGKHGFNLRLGSFKNRNNENETKRNIYLGSYRYFYAPLDLFTEITYGQYWNQDKGTSFELKRFFGETSVALYVKDSIKTFAGFNVSIPLSFRKLNKPSLIGQVKGKPDFSYGIRTVVRSPDGANELTPGGAIIPKSDLELATHYLDRDRLNASYIKEHLDRIREAYFTYQSL